MIFKECKKLKIRFKPRRLPFGLNQDVDWHCLTLFDLV
jgi:hypothetical protein